MTLSATSEVRQTKRPAGYRQPPESDLADEILLAAGKALYLANRFESKCKQILHAANVLELFNGDPVASLEEAVAGLPDVENRRLHRIVNDLSVHPIINAGQNKLDALRKAKDARNNIAHERAGDIGPSSHDVYGMILALRKLHTDVIDLANGDYVVSAWIHQIEDPKQSFWSNVESLEWVEYWVFGHIPQEWLDPDWKPDHQLPRTITEHLDYRPWYSKARP